METEHSEITFGPATKADLPFLLAAAQSTHDAHSVLHPDVYKAGEQTILIERYKAALSRGFRRSRYQPADLIVARRAGAVVGYVAVRTVRNWWGRVRSGSMASVDDIYVDPSLRGLGIGDALLKHAEAYAKRHRTTGLSAQVWQGNAYSQALFERSDLNLVLRIFGKELEGGIKPGWWQNDFLNWCATVLFWALAIFGAANVIMTYLVFR